MTTTRYYRTQVVDASVPVDTSWVAAGTPARHTASPVPWTASNVGSSTASRPSVRPNPTLGQQLVLPAFTEPRALAGSFRTVFAVGYTGGWEPRVRVRLVDAAGTHKALLGAYALVDDRDAEIMRAIGGDLTPAAAAAGDRIVVEAGVYFVSGFGGSATMRYGYLGSATADAPYETGPAYNSSLRPWVELTLDDPPAPPVVVDVDRRWWTHRLAAAAGLDPVAAQPIVQVRTWDGTDYVVDDTLSRGLQSYQVTYGRKDTTSRVEPLTCALVWATERLTSTPAVATRLQVALSPVFCDAIGLDPDDGIRFTGEVTDPAVVHARRLTTAATAGRLGRGHRMPVDGTGWPVESDAARVARILPAARVDLQVGTIDPPGVNVAPPTRLETVATLLDKTSGSALGQVVEQPSGLVDYHGPDHRRAPAVAVTLTAGQVLGDVTWSQRLASLVNDLDVKLDDGTVVTITDPESADPNRYGPWPASIDTILTSTSDAGALGVDVVGRRADPSWQLPDLTVDLVRTIPLEALPAVLALRHGSLLEVAGLPVGFPLAAGRMFVEGYVETGTPRTWSMVLQVSDPLQSGVGIRWIDWPDTDAYRWEDLDPDLTWLDLARIYDPADTL